MQLARFLESSPTKSFINLFIFMLLQTLNHRKCENILGAQFDFEAISAL